VKLATIALVLIACGSQPPPAAKKPPVDSVRAPTDTARCDKQHGKGRDAKHHDCDKEPHGEH
jgi:hypothetical protein